MRPSIIPIMPFPVLLTAHEAEPHCPHPSIRPACPPRPRPAQSSPATARVTPLHPSRLPLAHPTSPASIHMAVSETDVWHVTHYAPHILPPTAHGRLAPFALGPVMQAAAIKLAHRNLSFVPSGPCCLHPGPRLVNAVYTFSFQISVYEKKRRLCCFQYHAQSHLPFPQPFPYTHIYQSIRNQAWLATQIKPLPKTSSPRTQKEST